MTDNRTWLVTGAGGMLGQDVLARLSEAGSGMSPSTAPPSTSPTPTP